MIILINIGQLLHIIIVVDGGFYQFFSQAIGKLKIGYHSI